MTGYRRPRRASESHEAQSAPAFLRALRGMVKLYGGVRATGRLLDMSPSTVSRLAAGRAPDPSTATHIGRASGVCPCCGQQWTENSDAETAEPAE